jgi:DNA polymerase III alpha subunit
MHGHNTIKDIKADIDSKFFDSCGVIYDIKIHSVKSGKNKGKPMAFAKFVDLTGSIDITIFPDKFEKFHNSIISNKLVKLSMSKMDDGKLCVNKLSDIGAVYG